MKIGSSPLPISSGHIENGSWLLPTCSRTLRKQRIEVTGFAAEISTRQPFFRAARPGYPHEMTQAHAYRAGPALATIPFSHALSRMVDPGMAWEKRRDTWQLRSMKW